MVAILGAPVAYADETAADAHYARQSRIADRLDCPVCQGQSVKESNAPLAQQMRALINEKIADGASDEEIFDFFAARYGVGILRDPPKQGLALGVWLGPIVAAVAGVLVVGMALLRRRAHPLLQVRREPAQARRPNRSDAASAQRRESVTPVVLLLGLALVALGGLAWVTSPLLRQSTRRVRPRSQRLSRDVQRSLDLMNDLDLERLRGAISDAEHAELTAETRRQAALELRAQEQRRARAKAQVEQLIADRTRMPERATTPRLPPSSARRPLAWMLTAATLIVGLVAVVLVVTLGAREGIGEQTAVGNVGVPAVSGVAVSTANPETLVASHPAGLQVSNDGGATWLPTDVARGAGAATATRTGFIAITDNRTFRSDGAAAAWTEWSTSLDIAHLASGRESGRLVAIDNAGAIHVSDDDGASWRSLPSAAPPNVTGIAFVELPDPQILVSTSTEGVLAAGLDATWRSANGFVNGALPTVNVRALHYEPNSGDQYVSPTGQQFQGAVYVATDAGVFKSVDGMQSWNPLPLAADIVVVAGSAAAPRELYAIARDGAVFRSRDLGASWR